MDLRKIKKLIELVEESGVTELEVSSGDESIRISMATADMQANASPVAAPVTGPVAAPQEAAPASPGQTLKGADGRRVLPSTEPRCRSVC